MAGGPIDLWNEWEIQILVLLSFTLQVVLLIFAGIRRHEASPVLRLLLWLAYQLADSTAIYALGHLSLNGAARDHQLVAFWAPFLLLHLGGPDNITAYSLEDNKLWQRHLLTVVLQVLGAAYVLYKNIAVTGFLVVVAAVMMFVVGVLKYGERTWALKRSNLGSIRSSLKKEPPAKHYVYPEYDEVDLSQGFRGQLHEEFILRRAHSVFHICKSAAVDSSEQVDPDKNICKFEWKTMWRLVEMELSLLYDILYTKAAVVHTWSGYCIRAISPLATAGSFLLFHFSNKGAYSRVDVAITYALLVGAFFLEMISLLRALGSSWTLAFLYATRWSWLQHAALCSGRWDRFRRVVLSLRRLVMIGSYRRRWSGTIGQYNLFHLCTRRTSLLGRLAEMLGLNERWNKFHYSGTLVIPDDVKKLVFDRHKDRMSDRDYVNALGLIRGRWGEKVLEHYEVHKDIKSLLLDVELQECILVLHIATDVFLANRNQAKAQDAVHVNVKAIESLSNYMMFLLVNRPNLLPGLVLNRMYELTCDNLVQIWHREGQTLAPSGQESPIPRGNICTMLTKLFRLHDDPGSSRLSQRKKMAMILYEKREEKDLEFSSVSKYRVWYGIGVARELLNKEKEGKTDLLEALLHLWMDILFYVANRCSRESYAKKLNNGSELTAILWLMAVHFQPVTS